MATIVNAKFKQKRGTEASIPVLLEGELYVCTDTNKLYVGTASGNQLISDISQLNDLTQDLQNSKDEQVELWSGNLKESGDITLLESCQCFNEFMITSGIGNTIIQSCIECTSKILDTNRVLYHLNSSNKYLTLTYVNDTTMTLGGDLTSPLRSIYGIKRKYKQEV